MKLLTIHPFPARMAPEIALEECTKLPSGATVLDPMAGSGTVLRVAAENGYNGIGFDLDPLAVLISSVWTSQVEWCLIEPAAKDVIAEASELAESDCSLDWWDEETTNFVQFWFAKNQVRDLTRLAYVLRKRDDNVAEALRVCFSRLIITKSTGASLAADVSHSRPHRVRTENEFDVFPQFLKSARKIAKVLGASPVKIAAKVQRGDARSFEIDMVDAIITSPPYLNAIDYMRGHKLALVWLGYTIAQLRQIRTSSVGAERGPGKMTNKDGIPPDLLGFGWFKNLPSREAGMVVRYACDVRAMLSNYSNVLKPGGKAIFVIGNSCLRGTYIENSRVLELAAIANGLELDNVYVRPLPENKRYLPMGTNRPNNELGKRLRQEFVMTFIKP